MRSNVSLLARAVLLSFSWLWATAATAQTAYPEREIKILVGFTAGGTTDVIARMVGQELSIRWGKPVVIDNRPGAAGNIAIDIVAKAKPDGYTLAVGSVGPLAVNATLYKAMPYDNLKDLTPPPSERRAMTPSAWHWKQRMPSTARL